MYPLLAAPFETHICMLTLYCSLLQVGSFQFNNVVVQLTTSLAMFAVATTLVDLLMLYALPKRDEYNRMKYVEESDDIASTKSSNMQYSGGESGAVLITSDPQFPPGMTPPPGMQAHCVSGSRAGGAKTKRLALSLSLLHCVADGAGLARQRPELCARDAAAARARALRRAGESGGGVGGRWGSFWRAAVRRPAAWMCCFLAPA